MELTLLYRGPLKSCNYGCGYCPFAKHPATREEEAADRAGLERFVGWCRNRPPGDRLSVFFVPYGEVVVHGWYTEAMVELASMPHVVKVAAQTNLSGPLDWLEDCPPGKVGIWATYHPEWCPRDQFRQAVFEARVRGARISVGTVGLRMLKDEIVALRGELPPEIYLWINAVKNPWGPRHDHPPERYTPQELALFESIDPYFRHNLHEHASLDKSCRCGQSVVTVDGSGVVRRCPYVAEPIGRLDDLEAALAPRPCPNLTCGCYIGYVHMPELGLYEVYGDGVLERIPKDWPKR